MTWIFVSGTPYNFITSRFVFSDTHTTVCAHRHEHRIEIRIYQRSYHEYASGQNSYSNPCIVTIVRLGWMSDTVCAGTNRTSGGEKSISRDKRNCVQKRGAHKAFTCQPDGRSKSIDGITQTKRPARQPIFFRAYKKTVCPASSVRRCLIT